MASVNGQVLVTITYPQCYTLMKESAEFIGWYTCALVTQTSSPKPRNFHGHQNYTRVQQNWLMKCSVLRATELIQFSQCDLPPKILESTSQKNCKWKCWFFFSAKSLWKCWQDQSTNASLQDSPLFPPLKYIICITSLHLVSSPCSLRFLECPICT